MRAMLLAAWLAGLALPAAAQTTAAPPPETLEDIRRNLQAIDAIVQALNAQLLATGRRVLPPASPDPLARLAALEAEIRRLTGRVEEIQNQIRRMAEDAGRRFADVEFRLSEIEGGAAALPRPEPVPLGGPFRKPDGPATAVTEQAAFERARALLDQGEAGLAEGAFRAFLDSYPGGPLTQAARLGLARAQEIQGRPRDAARSYLDAFNADPAGGQAAEALFGVGRMLRLLGQMREACLTFDELARRFPEAVAGLAPRLGEERAAAGCP